MVVLPDKYADVFPISMPNIVAGKSIKVGK